MSSSGDEENDLRRPSQVSTLQPPDDSSSSSDDDSPSSSSSLNSEAVGESYKDEPPQRKPSSQNNVNVPGKYEGFLRKPVDPSQYPSQAKSRQERTYSDSENSLENSMFGRVDREQKGGLDMDEHADNEWGRRPLMGSMDAAFVESLIGWANTGTSLDEERSQNRGNDDKQQAKADSMNLFAHLPNTPLPLSHLNYFMQRSIQLPEYEESLTECFDTSALVAIGVIAEEMITASLLQLAGSHVLRCRQLEGRSPDIGLMDRAQCSTVALQHPITNESIIFDPRNLSEDESPFHAWTLPPEEAMLKAVSQGMVSGIGIPLVEDPVRLGREQGDKSFSIVGNQEAVPHLLSEVCGEQAIVPSNADILQSFACTNVTKRKISGSTQSAKASTKRAKR